MEPFHLEFGQDGGVRWGNFSGRDAGRESRMTKKFINEASPESRPEERVRTFASFRGRGQFWGKGSPLALDYAI